MQYWQTVDALTKIDGHVALIQLILSVPHVPRPAAGDHAVGRYVCGLDCDCGVFVYVDW